MVDLRGFIYIFLCVIMNSGVFLLVEKIEQYPPLVSRYKPTMTVLKNDKLKKKKKKKKNFLIKN
jgi:hypothetical protein